MREVDDAHDAEHQVEAEPHQGEIEAEHHAGDDRADQHARASPPGPRTGSAAPAATLP